MSEISFTWGFWRENKMLWEEIQKKILEQTKDPAEIEKIWRKIFEEAFIRTERAMRTKATEFLLKEDKEKS